MKIRAHLLVPPHVLGSTAFKKMILKDETGKSFLKLSSSIRYTINFPTVPKTGSASCNELLDFSGISLHATCGHLLI